jgi:hypothetical protein
MENTGCRAAQAMTPHAKTTSAAIAKARAIPLS